MTHVSPREHQERRIKYWGERGSVEATQANATDAKITKLYGPKGEVLKTFSDRPPAGFHQGQRGEPRR